MNLLLWVLQIFLALHTAMGAMWKFTNSEHTVPSLGAIPHALWMAMSGVELLCAVGLLLPLFYRPWAKLIPAAAVFIAAEMLLFVGIHLSSGDTNNGPLAYWIVAAALCAFLAYGRWVLKPLK
jgi:hypothetical protein